MSKSKFLYQKEKVIMKNWFIKRRDDIIVAIVGVLGCALMIGFVISGINDLKETKITFDDGIEQIELTDEMVEAYAALVQLGMEEWD